MRLSVYKSDTIGAFASSLCFLHCIATPFLFLAQTCAISGCHSSPTWWKSIDVLFLFVSFFAVYQSTKTTTNGFVKKGMWLSWSILTFCVLNNFVSWFKVSEFIMYFAALSLVILHIYNLKFCKCKNDACCSKIS